MIFRRNRLPALLSCLLLGLTVAAPAHAERKRILPSQSITTAGGAVSVTIGHAGLGPGPSYLVIHTSAKVLVASLTVTASLAHPLGTALLCTSPAITTETSTVVLLGSSATAADGVAAVCPFPLADSTTFTFTVTGASSGFTVAADLISIP
jgi:hypothetical protein